MRLALDTRTPLLHRLPELDVNCLRALGRKHVVERQLFLTQLLGTSYERRRPHSLDRSADSFDRDFLVQGLRVSPRGSVYTRLLEPFYEFPRGNHGYSKDKGTTKAYRLNAASLKALNAVYSGNEPLPVLLYDENDSERGLGTLPNNGLPSPLANRLDLPSVLCLPVSQIDRAIGRMTEWIEKFGDTMYLDPMKRHGMTLGEAQRVLRTARKWAVSLGGLPNLYKEQSHGRLGPTCFHLITMPSPLRQLLYEGSAMVDYDLTSCFWSIFQSLGRALSFGTPNVDDYVGSKAEWHHMWARTTGHRSGGDFKAVAASWLTGGTLSPSTKTESGQRLGFSAMQALGSQPATRALYQEIQHGMKRIVREVLRVETDGTGRAFVNAVGKPLRLDPSTSGFGRLCSHALTGYEQFAIREMCGQVVGLQAIIYDGFIAAAQPIAPLEERVRTRSKEVLGVELDVRLKAKDLVEPLPDPKRDTGDF